MRRATVAIIGRPNVGKSTLFNRIAGGRDAIVDDRPGVTRDRNFAAADWNGRHFWLVDTGGWVGGSGDTLHTGMRQQIETAIAAADAVLLLVDAEAGVHPADLEIASLLRPIQERTLVVANKCDDLPHNVEHHAFHELGLGEPVPISAAIGKGTGDLLDRIVALLPGEEATAEAASINVAVIGRPNVGKSSLVNRLLGEERSLVAPDAGTTRDAVDSPLRYHGVTLNFIDTAGLRKRSKVEDEIEFYSTLRTERAMDGADVCVLVIDAARGVQAQDLKIAHSVWERGSGLVVAVTKWDVIADKDTTTAQRGERAVAERAPFLAAVPFVYVSSVTGQRVQRVLELILKTARDREHRVATSEVNRVLRGLVERTQPPQRAGQEVKLLYGSQIGVKPPTFALVANRPEAIPASYARYLEKGFRTAWGFVGVPIRIKFRRKRARQ